MLSDVFENFRRECIVIYELDPAHVLLATRISMGSLFKKTEIELELLTDNDMLLMMEKGIRGRISHAMYSYATANNKYRKNYDKNIESSYLMHLHKNNLHRWAMSPKLLVMGKKYF